MSKHKNSNKKRRLNISETEHKRKVAKKYFYLPAALTVHSNNLGNFKTKGYRNEIHSLEIYKNSYPIYA